ncbi:MAG: 50S ribosomal protein L11 methyltransferase [Chloroflexota bacterium]
MDFIEITVEDIGDEAAEAVSEVFNRYGYGGAIIETRPPDFERNTVRTVISAEDDGLLQKIEISLALMDKALPGGLPEPALKFMGQNDWAESWKEHFHVVHVGERVVIQPSWRDYTPKSDDVVVHLDPGLAFGSGLHPTTQLCLRILQGMSLTDTDLFDVGTGSGILSIAAHKMGAGPIRAVDVDAVAVGVAEENFALNNITSIASSVGSAEDADSRTWSLVVANILSNILIDIMTDLKAALAEGGNLVLSGIINEQEAPFLESLQAHQLTIQSRHVEGDWIAFVVKKSSDIG